MPGRFGELDYRFPRPLSEGLIKARPNRFLMDVERDGTIFRCHCPATGRIGDLVFEDVPCLLSESSNKERKTQCTVEAISLDQVEVTNKSWIGINQTMTNRYLEHFILAGQL